jgi:hypothetical protein
MKKKILLKNVNALTFHAGQWTDHRRLPAIPQLQCISGPCGQAPIRVMQCRNVGFDGVDIQWKCSAELPDGYDLGVTTVVCEGFKYPDDP